MNRQLLFLTLMLALGSSLLAQTIITEDIASDTTWTLTGSPYILDPASAGPSDSTFDAINIVRAATLTIEAGVEVRGLTVGSGYYINVQGTLIAIGTATDSISFNFREFGSGGIFGFGGDGVVFFEYVNLFSENPIQSITRLNIKHSFIESGLFETIDFSGSPHPDDSLLSGTILIEDSQFGTIDDLANPVHVLSRSDNLILRNSLIYGKGLFKCNNGLVEGCTFYAGGDTDNESLLFQHNTFYDSVPRTVDPDADIQMLYNRFEAGSSLEFKEMTNNFGLVLPPITPSIIKYNQFCGQDSVILFNVDPLVITSIDLSDNCWCSSDTVDIMSRFSNSPDNPDPNAPFPAITLSPLSSICLPNQVYPGDANYNQIANAADLLSIGIAYGTTGPIRPMATTAWIGQDAPDWTDSLANGTNFKHVDCNGDGTIDSSDVQAITLNYGSIHLSQRPSQVTGGLPLYTDQLPSSLLPGDTIEFLIYLGTIDTLAQNVYGIAFGLSYDTSLVKPGGITVEFDTTWLGSEGSTLLTLAYDDFENGRLDIAEVRTNHIDTTGFGAIARTIVVLDDDISKKEIDMILRFEGVQAIGADEQEIPITGQNTSTTVIASTDQIQDEIPLQIYPNPASDYLHIESAQAPIQFVRIYNLNGQILYQEKQTSRSVDIPVSNMPTALYLLEIQTGEGIRREKVWISR